MTDDAPITLKEACETILRGKWTPATLRAEAGRGNLVIFRLGRTDCTTPADIERMVKLCRENRRVRASTSTPDAESGLSETERSSVALDALKQAEARLRSISANTSPRSTSRRGARTH